MTDTEVWEYGQIEFRLRYKGEDVSRSGLKHVWLTFQARTNGPDKSRLIGEVELPIAGAIAGASFVPQKNNIGHTNIHQILLTKLQKDGWELLHENRGAWWERRFRRAVQPMQAVAEQLKSKVAHWFRGRK